MVSDQNTDQYQPRPFAAKHVRYELITLGDELLLGLTANGHLTFIGAQLGRRGALLNRNVTITDEADAIAAQFRESWARADVVIPTGGLGPTCRDRTRDGDPRATRPAPSGIVDFPLVGRRRTLAPYQTRHAVPSAFGGPPCDSHFPPGL